MSAVARRRSASKSAGGQRDRAERARYGGRCRRGSPSPPVTQQPELARDAAISRLGLRVVIRVPHLDRVEPRFRETGEASVSRVETPGCATDASPRDW